MTSVLSLRTAFNLFWLGRYMGRLEGLCELQPLTDDRRAARFAQAFALPAWNAETLHWLLHEPTQPVSILASLQAIQCNTQEVRGCLSRSAYRVLQQLWRLYEVDNPDYCPLLGQACEHLQQELPELERTFWQLGLLVERLDRSLRLHESGQASVQALQALVKKLPPGWAVIGQQVDQLGEAPADANVFYALCHELDELFAEGPAACC